MKTRLFVLAAVFLGFSLELIAAPLSLQFSPIPLSEDNPNIKVVGSLEYLGGLKLRSENE